MKCAVFFLALLAGCAGVSAPPPANPEGPKRPINAMSQGDREKLRFVDPNNPEELIKR